MEGIAHKRCIAAIEYSHWSSLWPTATLDKATKVLPYLQAFSTLVTLQPCSSHLLLQQPNFHLAIAVLCCSSCHPVLCNEALPSQHLLARPVSLYETCCRDKSTPTETPYSLLNERCNSSQGPWSYRGNLKNTVWQAQRMRHIARGMLRRQNHSKNKHQHAKQRFWRYTSRCLKEIPL